METQQKKTLQSKGENAGETLDIVWKAFGKYLISVLRFREIWLGPHPHEKIPLVFVFGGIEDLGVRIGSWLDSGSTSLNAGDEVKSAKAEIA